MDLPQGPLKIGRWTVEPALHELRAGAATVKVEPKAMAVLCYLAQRPGQVASRDELLAAAWPGLVVTDDALTQVVVKLRRALDEAGGASCIQTIPKGGYRLVAPVAAGAEAEAHPEPAGDRPGRRRRAGWALAAGAMLSGVAFVAWRAGSPDHAEPRVPAADAGVPTLAVGRFEPASDDPHELLLARGIAADLATDLSKLRGLRVVSPGAEEVPGGTQPPAVQYRVAGSVQRWGDRVRLQVRLADVKTGALLWSERFDIALGGLFEMQDALGPGIARQLPLKLDEAERRRMARRYTRNLEAYETYQRGQLALQTRRRDDNEIARDMFRRAVALDAAFARAYVGLAMTYAADYRNQWIGDGPAALDRAMELARTAQRIDPEIPEAYWVLAFVSVHRRQHDEALRHLDEALRLSPSFADGYAIKGGILTSLGRADEGVRLLHAAMRLAPDSGYTYFMLLGRAYFALGQLEQARINLQHALARNPEFIDARVYLAATHLAAGDRASASWEADEIRTLRPGFTAAGWLETNPTADPRLRARLLQSLRDLGL